MWEDVTKRLRVKYWWGIAKDYVITNIRKNQYTRMELFQKRRRILWGAWGGVSERLGKDNVWGEGGVKIAKKKIKKVLDGFFLR